MEVNRGQFFSAISGSSGKTFRFDTHGDGPAEYLIMNLQQNLADNNFSYVTVGSWSIGKLSLDKGKIWWGNEWVPPLSRCSSDCPVGYVKGVQAGEFADSS